MSRPIAHPAIDRQNWRPAEDPPLWVRESFQEVNKSAADHAGLDDAAREYLVSRARYVHHFKKSHNQSALDRLIISDSIAQNGEMGNFDLRDCEHLHGALTADEARKDPSGEARVRASLLHAHFRRLKRNVPAERWPTYFDDLLTILKVWSYAPNEKNAFAQDLLIRHPHVSLNEIAKKSREHRSLQFDQSCLSQWIIAGWVLDPYTHLRPEKVLGTRHSRPPKR